MSSSAERPGSRGLASAMVASLLARVARRWGWGLALWLLVSPGAAQAEERPRVVLVTNHADAAVMPLLRAELERIGLEVAQVDHGADEVLPRDLRSAARATGAVAGFRVLVSERTVEVWIADRVTGKISLREVLPQQGDSRVSEGVVVTRAVELLRASLMELEAPHPPLGEVPAPAALARIASYPRPPARSGLWFGGGVLAGLYGGSAEALGTTVGSLGARLALGSAFSVGLQGASSLQGPNRSAVGGEVSFSARWIGLEGRHERLWLDGRLHGSVGLGIGVIQSRAKGDPVPGYTGTERSSVAPAPYLPLSVGWVVSLALRLDAQALFAWSLRPFAVASGGEVTGRFGAPVGGLGASLFVALP